MFVPILLVEKAGRPAVAWESHAVSPHQSMKDRLRLLGTCANPRTVTTEIGGFGRESKACGAWAGRDFRIDHPRRKDEEREEHLLARILSCLMSTTRGLFRRCRDQELPFFDDFFQLNHPQSQNYPRDLGPSMPCQKARN